MQEILKEADLFRFKLESHEGAQILRRILDHHLMDLASEFNQVAADSLMNFLRLQRRIPITVEVIEAQNFFFDLMKEHFAALASRSPKDPRVRQLADTLVSIAEALEFTPESYQRLLA